jgi:hypothetical protein
LPGVKEHARPKKPCYVALEVFGGKWSSRKTAFSSSRCWPRDQGYLGIIEPIRGSTNQKCAGLHRNPDREIAVYMRLSRLSNKLEKGTASEHREHRLGGICRHRSVAQTTSGGEVSPRAIRRSAVLACRTPFCRWPTGRICFWPEG